MKTFFAKPERSGKDKISKEVNDISNSSLVSGLLGTVGGLLLVLNDKRQILAINDDLLEILGITKKAEALGLRLGEVLNCVHSKEEEGGCGTSQYCSTCGAAIAIVSSLANGQTSENKCALEVTENGKQKDIAFKVKAHPITHSGKQFVLLFLQDISLDQQRAALERTFFHDINNLLCGLIGASDLLDSSGENGDLVDIIKLVSTRLQKEMEIQKVLLESETSEYSLKQEMIEPWKLIKELKSFFFNHPLANGKEVIIEDCINEKPLFSDQSLVLRIVTNMITNALEASEIGKTVTVQSESNETHFKFSVKNSSVIPEDIARRVFQRNFSTKASSGRGLGTFSMKLFGESVLGGKVDFTSTEEEGTTFTFSLPSA
jgi:K+-sensing histidine kinase KdpD